MRFGLIGFLLLLLSLESCTDKNRCYDSVDTLMISSFSVSGFKNINSMRIRGINRNDVGNILFTDSTTSLTKRVPLPLSLSADSTGFIFTVNGKIDTLFVRHKMIISFISEYCGFAPAYTLAGFRRSKGIDSIRIKDAKVNSQSILKSINDQNINIYFNSASH
jgi:Family of unknown function (DUF6452)